MPFTELQQEVMASPFSFRGDTSETKPSPNPILNERADIHPVKVITTDNLQCYSSSTEVWEGFVLIFLKAMPSRKCLCYLNTLMVCTTATILCLLCG